MGNVSIKVKLKPEPSAAGLHVVRLQITKDRSVRKWQTNIEVGAKQFNPLGEKAKKNWIRKVNHDHQTYNDRIKNAYEQVETVVAELEKTGKPFSADDIIARLRTGGSSDTLLGYYVSYLHRRVSLAGSDLGKLKTCKGLESTLKVLRHYVREVYKAPKAATDEQVDQLPRLLLRSLTRRSMEDLKAWMDSHYADNSIATYFSNLRTVLYAAVDDKIISLDDFPLRKFAITHSRKKVARLQETHIDQLSETEPVKKYKGGHPAVTDPAFAKPFALAIYYSHGARVRDMLMMRMKHYEVSGEEHRLKYTTGKNDKQMSVLFDQEAIALFAPLRYQADGSPKKPNDFLFPYLPENFDKLPTAEKFLELQRAGNRVRGQLRRMGDRVGLTMPITPHIMRHSFADMLRRNGVPLDVRQMSLGHSDIRTTRDYEEQFDDAAVDRISSLFAKRSTLGQQNGKDETTKPSQTEESPAD